MATTIAISVKGNKARISLSFAMIGVIGKDAGGAEQLLGEHGPGEQMRPGRLAEGEQQIGAGALRIAETIGAPDQEPRLADAAVAPALELMGEGERAELLAFLVKQNGDAVFRRGWKLSAALGQFGDLHRPCDPLQIAIDQIGLGA